MWLRDDFFRFCRGSGAEYTVRPLCSAIEHSANNDLVSAQLKKMQAVKRQDYESAAILRDAIFMMPA